MGEMKKLCHWINLNSPTARFLIPPRSRHGRWSWKKTDWKSVTVGFIPKKRLKVLPSKNPSFIWHWPILKNQHFNPTVKKPFQPFTKCCKYSKNKFLLISRLKVQVLSGAPHPIDFITIFIQTPFETEPFRTVPTLKFALIFCFHRSVTVPIFKNFSTILSCASSLWSVFKWVYRWTIFSVFHPNNSIMVLIGVPAITW